MQKNPFSLGCGGETVRELDSSPECASVGSRATELRCLRQIWSAGQELASLFSEEEDSVAASSETGSSQSDPGRAEKAGSLIVSSPREPRTFGDMRLYGSLWGGC